MDYRTLNALPAETFNEPARFGTVNDTSEGAARQYAEGLKIGATAEYVCVGAFGTWSAKLKCGASLTSYEGIGYHANTAALWKGFLDSGTKVVVHRIGTGSLETTVIREGKVAA